MDDRILLVPPEWAPDPGIYARWPTVHATIERLGTFLPVDHFRWPSLPGEPCDGDPQDCLIDAFRDQLRPVHHVICFVASELILLALSRNPVRSLTTTAFIPSPATVVGDDVLATALTAQNVISRKLSQVVPLIMQGATAEEVERVIADLRRTSNYDFVVRLRDSFVSSPKAPDGPIDIPALYLSPAVQVNPGEEPIFAIFRSFVPGAQRGFLTEWGLRIQEETGGHELADKVIPFIEEVIAARDAG